MSKFTYDYPMANVATDIMCFARHKHTHKVHILLIQRKGEPYKGQWAFPGGFLNVGRETVEECAKRELLEETGLNANQADDFYFYTLADKPDRDPRGVTISGVYVAIFEYTTELPKVTGMDDAENATWFERQTAMQMTLAFDHSKLLENV